MEDIEIRGVETAVTRAGSGAMASFYVARSKFCQMSRNTALHNQFITVF